MTRSVHDVEPPDDEDSGSVTVSGEYAAAFVKFIGTAEEPVCSVCDAPVEPWHDIRVSNGQHDVPPSGWYHQTCWPYVSK